MRESCWPERRLTCTPYIEGTIFRTGSGRYWSHIFQVVRAHGAALQKTTVCLSMLFLDFANGCAVARFAARSGRVEQHAPPFYPVAGYWDLGKAAGNPDRRSRLRRADDRRQPLQGPSPRRRSQRRKSGDEPHQRGLNTKIHLAVDAHGLPVRVLITQGTTADCTQAGRLIENISADYLLADKGYDSDAVIKQAKDQGMDPVIPLKKNRTEQRPYDEELYKLHYLVENAFLHLKRWRGIATRYAKNSKSVLAAVQIRCIALWANIS